MIENGVCDLWNESCHISRVSQPVLSASEESSRNSQCRDIILRGRVLGIIEKHMIASYNIIVNECGEVISTALTVPYAS